MKPLEARIQKVPLIQPGASWRRGILDRADQETRHRWSAWFWPSPLAWAGMLLIWSALAGASQIESRRDRFANAAAPPRIYVIPDVDEIRSLLAQRR